jgi:hypothetical protein
MQQITRSRPAADAGFSRARWLGVVSWVLWSWFPRACRCRTTIRSSRSQHCDNSDVNSSCRADPMVIGPAADVVTGEGRRDRAASAICGDVRSSPSLAPGRMHAPVRAVDATSEARGIWWTSNGPITAGMTRANPRTSRGGGPRSWQHALVAGATRDLVRPQLTVGPHRALGGFALSFRRGTVTMRERR